MNASLLRPGLEPQAGDHRGLLERAFSALGTRLRRRLERPARHESAAEPQGDEWLRHVQIRARLKGFSLIETGSADIPYVLVSESRRVLVFGSSAWSMSSHSAAILGRCSDADSVWLPIRGCCDEVREIHCNSRGVGA